MIRIFQHIRMSGCRAYGGDNAFAYPCNNGGFPGATYEAVDVGADGDPGPYFQFDAVLGHCRNGRGLDDLGIDAHLHRFQHVAACQVDGGGLFEGQVNLGAVGRNESVHHIIHVAAGQVMGFQLVHVQQEARFGAFDQGQHNHPGLHPPNTHAHKVKKGNIHPCRQR